MRNNIFTILTCSLIFSIASAQEKSTTKSLSIYKNGQSFVVKEFEANVSDNVYKLSQLPQALFGTYWFKGNSSEINSASSKIETFVEKQERKANSFLDLLHANKGKTITINTASDQIYKGTVEDFDLPEEINSKIQLQKMQLASSYEGYYSFDKIFTSSTPVILLKMNGKWISIEPSTIRSIEFDDKPNRTTTASISVQKPILSLHFAKSGAQTFNVMYLQNGLSWVPTYSLQLISETEADLSLQAEVANEVENIANTDIDFVVGVPNFSPATRLATILNFGKENSGGGSNLYSNATQFRSDVASERMVNYERSSPSENTIATENEDMYFYTIKNVSLEKGAKAMYPIFSQKIKIRHFYKASLPISTMNAYRATGDGDFTAEQSNEQDGGILKLNNVDHFVEIYNNKNNPLTSGPILITQKIGQKAIGQDVLKFTAKSSSMPVRITSSPDILVKENEKIVSLKKEAKKVDGYLYSLATVEGTVIVTNSKSKAIDLQVEKQIVGTASKSSINYKASLILQPDNINKKQKLDFDIGVNAGEKKTFTYTYSVYIRE